MSAINRVVKNTWILYVRMALTVFISLYATRLTLSALGITDFGLFNLVGGVIAMLTFLNNAMASATQRFMSFAEGAGDYKRQKEIFNVSTVLHIIIAILVFLILEIAGYFLFDKVLEIPIDRLEAAKMIMQFMVISTVFTIISVPYDAVINAHENMLLFAILGVIESVFKLGIALFLSVTPYDKLTTYGLLMAFLSIVLLFIRRIYCHSKYQECSIDFKNHFNKSTFKEMSSFAGWSFLGASSSMIANYGQIIILNFFFGTIINAAQGVAIQLTGQLSVFANSMLKALIPLISKSEGSGNRSLMLKATILGSKYSFFLLLFIYVPFFIEMPYIFRLWLKNIPEFAVIFCRLGLIRSLIEQLFVILPSSIAAVGNIRKYQISSTILNFFPLLFSYILFQFGFSAPVLYYVFIIYSLINGGILIFYAKVNFGLSGIQFFKAVVYKCLISCFIILFFSSIPVFFISESFARLILTFIIAGISFLLVFWFIGINISERNEIKLLLKRFLLFNNNYA